MCCDTAQALLLLLVPMRCDTTQALVLLLVLMCCVNVLWRRPGGGREVSVVDWLFSRQGPCRQHQKWTAKFWVAGKKTPGGMYGLVYQKYNKTETVREFRMKEGKVPWNLSRWVGEVALFHQVCLWILCLEFSCAAYKCLFTLKSHCWLSLHFPSWTLWINDHQRLVKSQDTLVA